MENGKGKDVYLMWSIPIIVSIILSFFEVYGKEHLPIIVPIGTGILLILFLILFLIRFLQDREERWKKNRKSHNELIEKTKTLEKEIRFIKENQNLNGRINKLANHINYIRGRIKNGK